MVGAAKRWSFIMGAGIDNFLQVFSKPIQRIYLAIELSRCVTIIKTHTSRRP
jgi:hypothetical protein